MGISTTSCGHESNVKTLLRVGSTKEIRKEYAELIMELKEVDGQIETFEMANKKFEMIKQNMPEKYDSKMALKVTQSKIVKMAQKAKLEEKSNALYNLIRDSERAVVKVKNHIWMIRLTCQVLYFHILLLRRRQARLFLGIMMNKYITGRVL